ncbi:MAG: FkbM family methyltransferase [Alphaproteobacteria bacterium]
MKPRPSLPIGSDRALVRLPGGEYVCVDLRSLDSFAYLLGWDLESDVVRIFRTFLTPRSVVLDIGANFGLYTALAAGVVGRQGRLYAFEGNPEIFPSLRRTLIANGHYGNPNVVAANVLVSDRCGRGVLYYPAEAFHLGTMSDVPLDGGPRRTAEVEMTTIDAFLPRDLAVDLVKIDVEGHEPPVLRGMERTIARSPNLRFLIEFADYMLAHTVKPAEFVDYIHALGFRVCRILPDYRILPVAGADDIAGFANCLLTRTPEQDVATLERRRRSVPVRFKRWLSRRGRTRERYRRLWHRL